MSATRRPPRRWLLILLVAVLLVLALAGAVAGFYTDLLWFREIGQTGVFWGRVGTKLFLGVLAGVLAGAVVAANLAWAERSTPRYRPVAAARGPAESYRALVGPYLRLVRYGVAALLGLIVGLQTASLWQTFLLWRNQVPFGIGDPQFGRDISFYVFTLPLLRAIFAWAFTTMVLTFVLSLIAHYLLGGIRPQAESGRVSSQTLTHLSVLLGIIMLLKAWAYRLDQFDLLYSRRGNVTGASYTDVNAQLPALQFLLLAAIATALLFFWFARQRSLVVPLATVVVFAVLSVLVGGLIPGLVQRFQVDPQQAQRESPYIQRNIDATLNAYGLRDIPAINFPATGDLTRAKLDTNAQTVDNVRLWQPDTLRRAISNLQTIGQWYKFNDVDVDRYVIDGQPRQVMIAAREVDPNGLQETARTWQNVHLAYTHGYGIVATRVNTTGRGGQPDFVVSGFDQTDAKIPVRQPRIYFGELSNNPPAFTVANTRQVEVGAPAGEGDSTPFHYNGRGGIQVSNLLRRAAFALRFRDPNLVLSGNLTADSRLMFNRDVRDRVEKAAPFLKWDADPYVAAIDGRIVFIRDGYTTTDMYPYAERVDLEQAARRSVADGGALTGRANYVRNSVKAVVDAYTGKVELYTWDTQDPILRAWKKAFPGLIAERAALDAQTSLVSHLRYPEDLFAVQADRYKSYHMTQALNFYSKQDFWDLPEDRSGTVSNQQSTPTLVGTDRGADRARPYYLLTKLPGRDEQQFVLVTPYTPNGKLNMVSYLSAAPSPDGKDAFRLLNLSRSVQVNGPAQVSSQILAESRVSSEVTLFNQQGSEVELGNMLTVPIDDGLLYVQPIFVQARGNSIPELKRVAVYLDNNVGYANDLAGAISDALGGTPPTTGGSGSAPAASGQVGQLLAQANQSLQDAQTALGRGDLGAYQRGVDRARQLIQQAQTAQAKPGSR